MEIQHLQLVEYMYKKSKDYFFSVLSEEQDKVSQEWGENDEGILLF